MKFFQLPHKIGFFSQFQWWGTWIFKWLGHLSQVTSQQVVPKVLAMCWHVWTGCMDPSRIRSFPNPLKASIVLFMFFLQLPHSLNHTFKVTQLSIQLGLPVRVSFLRADLPQCPSWTLGQGVSLQTIKALWGSVKSLFSLPQTFLPLYQLSLL